MDSQTRGCVKLAATDTAFEVFRLLVLHKHFLVIKPSVAVVTKGLYASASPLLSPHLLKRKKETRHNQTWQTREASTAPKDRRSGWRRTSENLKRESEKRELQRNSKNEGQREQGARRPHARREALSPLGCKKPPRFKH